jgi:acyl carrier protein
VINEDNLRAVLAGVLRVPVESIGPESSMDNIESWDSLQHMNLVLALEEEFGVSIPDEDAANVTSYRLIKLVLEELIQAK